ncbi:hypothetical protein V6N12_007288 [Hibiscus sabdariffa]|uniref:Retrovirus-related Pol polyprotein from transposon TNT 1-94-like beta-barrel domain-containing protein n=1 Tax=Hibiscus sabdariffa TaxID=183260 RepID=A0ABR2F1B2_9ROSI
MMALKYKEGTSTADHVSEFQSVMNQLLGIITLDLAKSGVLNEEVRRRSQSFTSQSDVLVTENRGETEKKMKGHIKKYCFKLKRENKGGGVDKHDRNDEEKFERVAVTREDLLVICDENLVNLACDETSWVIDIGASIHVTLRRDFFTSYTHGDFGVLKMGNDGLVSVIGMRDVSLGSKEDFFFSSCPPHRKSELLELVHSDVCGPIKTIVDIAETEKEDSPDSGDFDAPIDDVVTDQQQAHIAPPTVPLQRSSRDR